MSFLKLSAILCTFLVLQAQALPQHQAPLEGNQIIEIITGVVNRTESMVDGVLNIVSDKLDEFVANPDPALRKRIAGLLEKVLDRLMNVTDARLDRLKEAGNNDTKVIVGCVQKEQDNFRALVNATFDQNSKCMVDEIVAVLTSVQSIVGDLKTVQGDVKESLDKLDGCTGDNTVALLCAADVARKTVDVVVKNLPEATSADVKALIEVVRAFPESFKTCIKSNVDDFRVKIVGLVDEISTCARKH